MLITYGGDIDIGVNCSVNPYCVLYGLGGLKIGDNVRIAAHTVIVPANHTFDDPSIPICRQPETKKGIIIEDDVWIGAGCRILDGVRIGRGSVIGAGSVVTKSIPEMSVAVGVPARVIRRRGA
jgi:acetyltransferase-like isoleucine patch superfamily enzyme